MDTTTIERRATIRLHPDDNVVVAREPLAAGAEIPGEHVVMAGHVLPGHKVATRAIETGQPIVKYGQVIGFASRPIAPGEHVHTQNVALHDFDRAYEFSTAAQPTDYVEPVATFQGIVRADGRVATRNYIGILSSVNCSATVSQHIAAAFHRDPVTGEDPLADFPNVDGVVALTHRTGCGQAAKEPVSTCCGGPWAASPSTSTSGQRSRSGSGASPTRSARSSRRKV